MGRVQYSFWALLFVLLVGAIFLTANTFAEKPAISAQVPIKIGVMLHLTGDFGAWGEAYLRGAEVARESINAAGGVHGRPIEFIVEDIRFDSRLSATASKKLLEIDKVPAAMISTFTEAMVAGPLFERAKVPLLVIGDSGEEIDRLGDYVFSTGTWSKGYAVSASQYLTSQLKLKKIGIIATNNAWSQAAANNFAADVEPKGGKILWREDLNPQDADFRTVLQRVRTSQVDAVFAPITSNPIPFYKQAQELRLALPIIAAGGVLDVDVIEAAGPAVEGRYVTNSFLDESRPAAQVLLTSYRRKYHSAPRYPSVTGRGYDACMALIQALQTAPQPRPEMIKEALYKVDFEGAGFHVHMSPAGGAELPVRVLQVQKGTLVPVD